MEKTELTKQTQDQLVCDVPRKEHDGLQTTGLWSVILQQEKLGKEM